MDSRQLRRLKKRIKESENRINKEIFLRVAQLADDKNLAEKMQNEIKDLKTREDFNAYIRMCYNFAKSDV